MPKGRTQLIQRIRLSQEAKAAAPAEVARLIAEMTVAKAIQATKKRASEPYLSTAEKMQLEEVLRVLTAGKERKARGYTFSPLPRGMKRKPKQA